MAILTRVLEFGEIIARFRSCSALAKRAERSKIYIVVREMGAINLMELKDLQEHRVIDPKKQKILSATVIPTRWLQFT